MGGRRWWAAAALAGAALVAGAPRGATAQDCQGYDPAQHKSGCADVSVSPATVRPGDTITVSIQLNCGGASVYCSYAEAEGIVVDGATVTGSGGFVPMYHGTEVYPAAGFQVPISGNGGHSVTFRIREDAPDACVEQSGPPASGPWVSVGSGSSWSTPVPFRIDRNAEREVSLGMTATTPRPDEVRPGEKIDYAVTATLDGTAESLKVWVPLPSGTVLVPDTISDGGVVRSNELRWSFGETGSRTVRFTAQVRDARQLRSIDEIVANGRAQARFPGETASDSVRVTTRLAKPTQVRGTVYDAKLDFPRRTFVDENDPLGGVTVELLDAQGAVVDSTTTDSGGRYEVEAGETGTFKLRVTARADRYDSGRNSVEPLLDVVQEREVEITALSGPPVQRDVRVPKGLLAHAAESLRKLNNLEYSFAGIVPHAYRMDTTGIEAEIGFLAESGDAYELSTEPHAPNRWDSLVRLSACLRTMSARYVDMAIAIDDLAKVIPVAILIQIMQKEGTNFATKYAGVVQGRTPPPTAGSRLTEAAKITTLAYVIGNYLPPLLDKLQMPREQKAAVIELTYKLVRFGMNLFVPGMNAGDIVFEIMLQTARTAIFEGGINAARVLMQAEVDHAYQRFGQTEAAGTHAEALAALSLFDDRVLDRSRQLHRITLDALFSISAIIRGTDGIVFKVQQSIGLDQNAGRFGRTLQQGLKPISKALGFLKSKLFIPYFATAAACAAGTVALTPVDIHSEVTYTFQGFPADARPLDLGAVNDVVDDWIGDWVRRYSPFQPSKKKPAALPRTTRAECVAMLDRLDAVAAQIRADDAAAYGAGVDAAVSEVNALGASLIPLIERCVELPWADDPRLQACVIQGSDAVLGLSQAFLLADAWSIEPSAGLARDALAALSDASRQVNEAGLAADAAEVALGGVSTGAKLYVTAAPVAGAAPGAEVEVRVTVRNAGGAALSGGSAELEPVSGLALASAASVPFGALAPGASTEVAWRVTAPASGPALAAYTVLVTSPDARSAGLAESFVVAE